MYKKSSTHPLAIHRRAGRGIDMSKIEVVEALLVEVKAKNKDLRIELDKAEKRERALAKFAGHIINQYCWDMPDSDKLIPDGADIQEVAELMGLIASHTVTADEADGDYGVGDTKFKFSDILLENDNG